MGIAIFIVLIVISFKASKLIRKNSEVFKEFNLSTILSYLVYSYPIGQIPLMTNNENIVIFSFLLVIVSYIVTLIIAKKQNKVLSQAGTDRVDGAKKAISLVILAALISFIYLFLIFVISFGVMSID